jgi:hypothetical protein
MLFSAILPEIPLHLTAWRENRMTFEMLKDPLFSLVI